MKKLLLLFIPLQCLSQSPQYSLFLIGDAGEHPYVDSTIRLLQQQILNFPNSAVIFLGDNIYPAGLIEEKKNDKNSHQIIQSQLAAFKNYNGRVYYIPGNHDWCNSNDYEKGKTRLQAEENYIEKYLADSTKVLNRESETFLPSGGSPGPVHDLLNNNQLKLIFVDSQWFMYLHYRKAPADLKDSAKLFFTNLDNMLVEAREQKQHVVVAAHHPLFSNANHSKEKRVLGFNNRLKYQDLVSKPYAAYIRQMDSVLKKYPGTMYAAGHDHGLQYFRANENDYLVSGGGSKVTSFSKKHAFNPGHPYQEIAQQLNQGFFRIDYFEDSSRVINMILSNGLVLTLAE